MPQLPTFRKANPAAAPILILALTSKTMQPSAIYDAADSIIAQRLSQVDGVADVTVAGSEQPAIRVRVDPARLSAMGLSMEDVRTAISNSNAAGPLGTFDGDKRAVTIGINDQLRNADEYDPLVVKTVNGTVIRLSNIATITASVRNSRAAGWYNKTLPFCSSLPSRATPTSSTRSIGSTSCYPNFGNGCRPASTFRC